MKIINMHPGILPIPPKNWGAIEKIIWNYHLTFQKLGFETEIKYLDNIEHDAYSIIHSHVTNLSNMATERGHEYFLSLHDHHVLFDFPDAWYLDQTRKAIQNSIKTIIHTPEFFTHKNFKDLSDKFIYVQHGVDRSIYKDADLKRNGLLCVASNGFVSFKEFDRKGFLLAKQVAEFLSMPLTICCPSNTRDFMNSYGFLDSANITVLFDLNEDDLIKQYQSHKIFLHPSILEAGHPNLTLVEALACGLPVVGAYKGELELKGMCVVNDGVPNSYAQAIKIVLDNYDVYRKNTQELEEFTWEHIAKKLIGIYKKYGHTRKKFVDALLGSYSNTNVTSHTSLNPNKINVDFDNGVPKVNTSGPDNVEYNIKFNATDDTGIEKTIYSTTISNNMWAAPADYHYKKWRVISNDIEIFKSDINFSDACAVISTYPNTVDVLNKTVKCIDNIKNNISVDVICANHYKDENVDSILAGIADQYVLDTNNVITHQTYYRYYRGFHDGYNVELDFWNSGNGSYHGPAVLQNYYNGVQRAKELGYKYAILTNFDMIFSEQDNNKIKNILSSVIHQNKNGFFLYTMDQEGPTYKTVFCIINVDVFLSTFPQINTEDDYTNLYKSLGSESNGLENMFYHALKNTENLIVVNSSEIEFFNSSECFTNSQTNYFSILPIEENNAGIFIKRANKNVDPYNVRIDVLKNGQLILNEKINVNDELYKIIPITIDNDSKYEFTLTAYDTSPPTSRILTVNSIHEIKNNGKLNK